MKNMFLVINKEKIYAYVVSFLTIVTLFFMSSIVGSLNMDETESTDSSITQNETENIENETENETEGNESDFN